eukprot:m.297415 g.297415  ORF g.297415 m.297415 type:complete len:78 (+) comp16399_c1_seq8:186-419(+)
MIRLMMVPPLLNEARPAVCGLSNLGNTCFFNAVMQCINRSAPFVRVVREISKSLSCIWRENRKQCYLQELSISVSNC